MLPVLANTLLNKTEQSKMNQTKPAEFWVNVNQLLTSDLQTWSQGHAASTAESWRGRVKCRPPIYAECDPVMTAESNMLRPALTLTAQCQISAAAVPGCPQE